MKQVAGYGRVSTAGQVEGTSLEDQQKKIKAYCKKENYKLFDLYIDEGISGGTRERRELKRMIADAKTAKFEAILFTKLDRLGRSARDIHNLWFEFRQLNIDLICIEDPSVNTTGKIGSMMLGILSSFAQFERETIKERTQGGRQASWDKKQLPIGNHQLPYGYQKNAVTKHLEIIPKQATIYKKIVSLYLNQRLSWKSIAVYLTREGIPTPSASKGLQKKSVRWSSISIGKMLKNPAYKGEGINNLCEYKLKQKKDGGQYTTSSKELKPETQWIRTKFPPLISEGRWQELQDRMLNQKRKPKRVYKGYEDHFLLDGFIYCGECGGRMRKKVKMEKSGKVRLYYTCFWRGCSSKEKELAGRPPCYLNSVDAQKVDKEIFEKIIDLLTNPKRFIEAWFKDQNVQELQEKVANLERHERDLHKHLTEGFKLYNSAEDSEVKKIYWNEQKVIEQDWATAKADLKQSAAELDAIDNKADRYEQFSAAIKKGGAKKRLLIRHGTFGEFMEALPFLEKKRIVEAIISPENGGKCEVAYIRPTDFLDEDELKKIPKKRHDKPLTDRSPQVFADFQLDPDRVEAVINSLDHNDLLNKLNEN